VEYSWEHSGPEGVPDGAVDPGLGRARGVERVELGDSIELLSPRVRLGWRTGRRGEACEGSLRRHRRRSGLGNERRNPAVDPRRRPTGATSDPCGVGTAAPRRVAMDMGSGSGNISRNRSLSAPTSIGSSAPARAVSRFRERSARARHGGPRRSAAPAGVSGRRFFPPRIGDSRALRRLHFEGAKSAAWRHRPCSRGRGAGASCRSRCACGRGRSSMAPGYDRGRERASGAWPRRARRRPCRVRSRNNGPQPGFSLCIVFRMSSMRRKTRRTSASLVRSAS